jgi:hypothetical protein
MRFLAAAFVLTAALASAAHGQETHALVVGGIGGDAAYRSTFQEWAATFVTAATERLGIPSENVTYLAERPEDDPLASDKSTRTNIERAVAEIAQRAAPQDRVIILLIGHGAYSRGVSTFNLPGPDLSSTDFSVLLDQLSEQRVVFVNSSSASGGWVKDVSAPGRTIITGTKTGMERNETVFGGYFVAAFDEDGADVDKDGRISVLEAFRYATREVTRSYQSDGRLQTEHALLDDNGDGEGSTEIGEDALDGALARTFLLGATAAVVPETDDPVLKRWYGERADLERRVVELRAIKDTMDPERYDAEIEGLLVELALKNREIRRREGGRG